MGSHAKNDVIINFEHAQGGAGGDKLTAAMAGSSLLGGLGNDSLIGGAGADTLDGQGGAGDRVDYAASAMGVTVSLADAITAETGGSAAGDVLINVEVVLGSDSTAMGQGDSLQGSAAGGNADRRDG